MNRQTARAWAAGAALVAGVACQSAAPRSSRTQAPAPDAVDGFVGRTVILRSRGDAKAVQIKHTQIGPYGGHCDVVAVVRAANFQRGTVRFTLDAVGRPRTQQRNSHNDRCGADQTQIALTVTGFPPDTTAAAMEAAFAPMLQTPEAYLRYRNIKFEPRAAADAAVPEPTARFTAPPTRLLWADAVRPDPSRKVRHEGEVEVEGVVGLDGRLHSAKVLTPLSREHEDSVLRVVPLWRFQPGRRGEEAVAVKVRERLVFRII